MENTALWAALAGLVSAQLLKPLISILTGQGFRPYLFITTGGMPSSHTSAVSALTISIAMTEGLDSSIFAICIIISLVIMNDATNVRLEKAKELLKNTDAKTYEIAEKTGFSEPNYFSFIFKKNLGISPSQYRAKNR